MSRHPTPSGESDSGHTQSLTRTQVQVDPPFWARLGPGFVNLDLEKNNNNVIIQ